MIPSLCMNIGAIAKSSPPPSAPAWRGVNGTSNSTPGTGTVTQSLSSIYTGALASAALIVIGLGLSMSATGAPSSVTVDGNAATFVAYTETNASGTFNATALYSISVNAGVQPSSLVVTKGSGTIDRFECSFTDLVGLASTVPVDAQTDSSATTSSSVNVNCNADGVLVGMTNTWRGYGATGTVTWSGNMSEDFDNSPVWNLMWSSGAHGQVSVSGNQTVSITRVAAAGNGAGLAVASWR